ncbi:MAG: hypothetical protein WD118_06590 [Phycisphaeraceae bacterium]
MQRQVLGWFTFRTKHGSGIKKIWVHQTEIAKQLGLGVTGKTTVARAISHLVALKLIVNLGQLSPRKKTQYIRGECAILYTPQE